jgi:heat shock protein HtpX
MEPISFHDEISRNKRNSYLLVFFFVMLIGLVGYGIGFLFSPGWAFIILSFAIFLAIVEVVFSYYYSDRIVLAATKARPATESEHRYLIRTIEALALGSGIPKPRIYVIDSPDINAFATGRDPEHGVVVVTTGLLKNLNRQETEGVLAHEMSHIANYDIRFATLVAVLVGIVAIVSQMALRSMFFHRRDRDREERGGLLILVGLILAILAPISAKLAQLAISRRREFLADASGAKLSHYPDGLADALEKIKRYNTGKLDVSDADSHLFIANPFKTKKVTGLFSTHPDIDERIKRLRAM